MLIAIGSLKASPGVSTAALALAAMWPGGQRVLLVEADPSGGVLCPRFSLTPERDLVSLSAEARSRHDVQVLFDHATELPGGLRVITAPRGAEQATSALDLLVGDGAPLWRAVAADPSLVVIVDCGRLDPGSPAHRLLAAADVALVCARPVLEEADVLAERLNAFLARSQASDTELGLVLIGSGAFKTEQVETAMAMRVWAHLPSDAKAAATLSGAPGGGALHKLALPKAARALGVELAAHAAHAAEAEADSSITDDAISRQAA